MVKLTAVKEALERFGQVEATEGGGALILRNDGQPSFLVESLERGFRISPIFGKGVSPSKWWKKANQKAVEIEKALSAALSQSS